MGNIILTGVTVFVVVMIAIGMKRGLVKTAFSFGSIFIALVLVNILTPVAKEVIKNTPVYDSINQNIQSYVSEHIATSTENMTETGINNQEKIINELPLPNGLKESLTKNNNQSRYDSLAVNTFKEYVVAYLTDVVLNAVVYILLFMVISILMKTLVEVLNIVTKLPVIHTFNMAGGALIGFAQAILIIWLLCMVVTIFSSTSWGQTVCKAIADNGVLSMIYDNNLIQNIVNSLF